ncbi:MAG TPA: mechanosensitive ion channel family protein [Anaeromyxobacter sp.]|nr:mechanosensitive ion channel family protein [Anaeromyxobacter sp.]
MKTPTPFLLTLARLAVALPAAALAQDGARPPALPTPTEARPFFESHLPSALLQGGPLGLLWWQWLALPVVLALGVLVGWLLGYLSRALLARVAARTRNTWDDQFIVRAAGPITALWTIAFVTAVHPWLLLGSGAAAVLERVLRAATYLTLFWGGFRLVDVGFAALGSGPWARGAGQAGLLPLGRKVSKIALLAVGAVAVLNELGFQVASLLAGLGIGGIALALAAQKTVENLFGSVAIGVDRPFLVGDFVKVEDFVGTVESIGMRSTRFRTLDRTVITIPNGKLADSRSENFAVRDRIRLFTNLALSYGTTAAQMRAVLAGIEEALRKDPRIAADAPSVRFTEFRESALNVEVMAWFATADWAEFARIRQEVYLRFMEIVRGAGAEFAFPVRTVRLVPGAEAVGRAPAAAQARTDDP